jgi:hypothetical protein
MFLLELSFLRIITVLTGALIAGEALALTIGMYFMGSREDPWVSRNTLFLVMDVVIGFSLIYLGLAARDVDTLTIFYLLAIMALITHGYREWEYFADVDHKFCFNIPLFVVNNLKLLGLVIISIGGLILKRGIF